MDQVLRLPIRKQGTEYITLKGATIQFPTQRHGPAAYSSNGAPTCITLH